MKSYNALVMINKRLFWQKKGQLLCWPSVRFHSNLLYVKLTPVILMRLLLNLLQRSLYTP